jgi:hypothetical protein
MWIAKMLASDFAVMPHSYDNIALFVSFLDIPVSLDNFLQGIASVNDRLQLSRLNYLFDED